jgi:hypothetical protein
MDVRPRLATPSEDGPSDRAAAVGNMAKVVGEELMKRYVIAFEVAGLLLTAALVGAIAIAHREEIEPASGRGSTRSSVAAAGTASENGQESVARVNVS